MNDVTFRYFVADASDPESVLGQIVAEVRALVMAHAQERKALCDEVGTPVYYGNSRLLGFCFPQDTDPPKGLRRESTSLYKDVIYNVMVPDKRTPAGKALAKKLLAHKAVNFSGRVCQAVGVYAVCFGRDSSSRSGMSLFESVCGVIDGSTVLFKIPFGDDSTTPPIPDYLRPIAHSEFIYLSEERHHG